LILNSFSDFNNFMIIPIISACAHRSHFTGWNEYRTLVEHQLILIDEGHAVISIDGMHYTVEEGDIIYISPNSRYGLLKPLNCKYVNFINVQFSYVLIKNQKITWRFDSEKNFSIMETSKSAPEIFTDNQPLPFSVVQKAVNFTLIREGFVNLSKVRSSRQIGWEWQSFQLFSGLLLQLVKNHFFYSGSTSQENRLLYVNHLIKYFSENLGKQITLDDMINITGVSKSYLIKIFKELTNMTPLAFLNQMRIDKAKDHLLNHRLRIRDIALMVGFTDEFYFSRIFKKIVGISPRQFKNENQGIVPNYTKMEVELE